MLGFSVFLLCCLITYHPDDPSFETGYSSHPPRIYNCGKLIGSYLSSLLFQVLGLGAYVVPIVLGLWAVKLLFRPAIGVLFFVRSSLYLLLFVCAELFLSLCVGTLHLPRYRFNAGGLIGSALSAWLTGSIGSIGTYLVLIILSLIGFMGLTRISYVGLWQQFWRRLQGPADRIAALARSAAARLLAWFRASLNRSRFERKKRGTLRPGRTPSRGEPIVAIAEPLLPDAMRVGPSREEGPTVSLPIDEEVFVPPDETFSGDYILPSLDLLDDPEEDTIDVDKGSLRNDAEILTQRLADFNVFGRVVEINPGPVITRFEFEPAPGIKINRIITLADDLALALKAMSVRIAPIPGKSVVGIEIPNKRRKMVAFKDVVSRETFQLASSKLTIGLGKDIAGGIVINDLARMPHLLVAGATGSGKSIFVNTVICSILFRATPDEVRFLMIDPKRLELFPYDGIPHLLHPVVVEPRKAAVALRWVVEEMDRRYEMLAARGARDIEQYNRKIEHDEIPDGSAAPEKMTYIVVVIDELADLMMIAARDVEGHIARLAQMARASGIHLLIATQRPSVDILTGVIKANFPCRISFQVSSKVDSRTIIDTVGAEKLLGRGDMLFMPPGTSRLQRIHGAHIAEQEIKRITEFIKKQRQPLYNESIIAAGHDEESAEADEEEYDELYDKALALVADTRQVSISMLQRRMRVGYNRAARMIERMEREGVVGPSDGVKPRDVLVNKL